MRGWPVAVRLESVGKPFREALETAARLGFQGVEFDAVGDLSPGNLSQTGGGRCSFCFVAWASFGGVRVSDAAGLRAFGSTEVRIEATVAAMLLAYELGSDLVINQLGIIPAAEDEAKRMILSQSLSRLSNEGDRVGARIAFRRERFARGTGRALGISSEFRFGDQPGAGFAGDGGEDIEAGIEKLAPWIAEFMFATSSGVRWPPRACVRFRWVKGRSTAPAAAGARYGRRLPASDDCSRARRWERGRSPKRRVTSRV